MIRYSLFPLVIFAVVPICLSLRVNGTNVGDQLFPVSGTVVDQNGSAIVGATIELSQSTHKTRVLTNEHGEFTVSLGPGAYDVEVNAAGFRSFVRTIDVEADGNKKIELVLEVESATAIVNVSDRGDYQIGTINS